MRKARVVNEALPDEVAQADGIAYSLWLPAEPAAHHGGVVILHGAGSCKESHHDFARVLVAAGIAAITFDQRGHGASDGPLDGRIIDDIAAMGTLLRERVADVGTAGVRVADVRVADVGVSGVGVSGVGIADVGIADVGIADVGIADVGTAGGSSCPATPADVPLAVRGSSMGGYLSLVAAARLHARAVVAICPAGAEALRRGLLEGRFEFDADVQALEAFLSEHDASEATAELDAPVLLLHAEGDEQVPVQQSRELARLIAHPDSRLVAVPGGHHRSIQHDPEMQTVSARFIDRALARAQAV